MRKENDLHPTQSLALLLGFNLSLLYPLFSFFSCVPLWPTHDRSCVCATNKVSDPCHQHRIRIAACDLSPFQLGVCMCVRPRRGQIKWSKAPVCLCMHICDPSRNGGVQQQRRICRRKREEDRILIASDVSIWELGQPPPTIHASRKAPSHFQPENNRWKVLMTWRLVRVVYGDGGGGSGDRQIRLWSVAFLFFLVFYFFFFQDDD